MSKLVEALGIILGRAGNYPEEEWVISERELEAALEKLPVMYGRLDGTWWAPKQEPEDTHTARLLCIEEIEKKPLKHDFETEVVSNNEFGKLYTNMIPSSFVGKKVKVTVEEVR